MVDQSDVGFVTVLHFVEHAKLLRDGADRSERRFLEFLRAGEALEDLWRPFGTFDRFLRDTRICTPDRYRQWVKAQATVDPYAIDIIGAKGALALVSIADDERRAECTRVLVATAKKEGAPLSAQTANYHANKYRDLRPSLVLRKESREIELEREVIALRAANKKLAREKAALEKEIAHLRAAASGGVVKAKRAAKQAESRAS